MLEKGADPNIPDYGGWTALFWACSGRSRDSSRYQITEILPKKGADPNIHDINGWTALIIAAENGYQQVMQLLFEKQVDLNVQNSNSGQSQRLLPGGRNATQEWC